MVKLDTGECTINNLQIVSTILGMQVSADIKSSCELGFLNDVPVAAVIWDSEYNITQLKVLQDYKGWGLGNYFILNL